MRVMKGIGLGLTCTRKGINEELGLTCTRKGVDEGNERDRVRAHMHP